MRFSDIVATVISVVFGGIAGFLIGGVVPAIIGATLGLAFGVVAGRANVRPAITMTVWVGAMTGALIGSSIVETICLPGSCAAVEATAAVVIGIASLIGVGLVAALVTRSFDEYNEHQAAGTEPPGVGCEAPDDTD